MFLYRTYLYLKSFRIFHNIKSNDVTDILICGMPRSGSTLVFNIVRDLYGIENDENRYFKNIYNYNKLLLVSSDKIFKTHIYDEYIRKRIISGKTKAIFTYRDIRDVTVSLHQRGWLDDTSLFCKRRMKRISYNSLLYAAIPQVLSLRYEEFFYNAEQLVRGLKDFLEIEVDDKLIDEIISKYSRDNVSERLNNIEFNAKAKDEYNISTGFHKNHIYDSEIGKWENYFSIEYRKQLSNDWDLFLDKFGYKKNT